MVEVLNELLERHNAQLIKFEFYYEIFGNIVTEIRFKDKIHKFATDRGEIYHNQHFICSNSYHIAGKSDAFPKLLEVIERELFTIS